MPFDPRLIHPDQPPLHPDGELDLPADLAALAEQLTDDAAHLAASYPATCHPDTFRPGTFRPDTFHPDTFHPDTFHPDKRTSPVAMAAELAESAERISRLSRRRRALFLGASALGAGLASLAALAVSLNWMSANDAPAGARPLAATSALIAPLEPEGTASAAAVPLGTVPLRSSATLSVGELSGPELEALLDLLHGEPQSVASISF